MRICKSTHLKIRLKPMIMKKLLTNFKKGTPPDCSEGAGSTPSAVLKKAMRLLWLKKVLPLLLFFFVTTAFSQQLFMDHYVGCTSFGNGDKEPPRMIDFTETTDNGSSGSDSSCFRVCEHTDVNYFFLEPNTIESVKWEVTGGTIVQDWDTPEHKALVRWGVAGPGTLAIEITYTNGEVIERIICVEKINGPKAEFQTEGMSNNRFCTNAPVLFDNLSIGGIHYLWDFGDDANPESNYSSAFEPQYTYTKAGTYTVTLTVVGACNCAAVYSMEVYIEDAPPILISCPGVVCERDRVTYTVTDRCPGNWIVEGGHIIGGGNGQAFIDVIWDDVDPVDGFGYIHYQSICGCPFWTTEKIPIVSQTAEIQGAVVICEGTQSRYTLPQWPTTEYNWSLNPETPGLQQLVWLDQRNEVIIDALKPGTYRLTCEYYNTLLGCGGIANILVEIIPKIEIVGEPIFCFNTMIGQQYTTVLGQPVDWKLISNYTNSVVEEKFNQLTYEPFVYPNESYTLIASSDECSSAPFQITVLEVNTTPFEAITGPEVICPGQTYSYSCENNAPNTVLVWSVTGNAEVQGSHTGNSVNIKYTGAGPYEIKVERVATGDTVLCEFWTEATLAIQAVDVQVQITHNYNSLKFCPSNTSLFTADLGGVTAEHISWQLTPSNFGSIITGGTNNEEVSISWNDALPGQTTATLTLTVTVCGLPYTDTVQVEVFETPSIAVGNIASLCPTATTIDVPVTITGPTAGLSNLRFDFAGGGSQTVAFSGNGIYTVNNLFVNASATDITQALTVSILNPNNCDYSPSAVQNVTVFPQTIITIFPESNPVYICTSEPYFYPLVANISTGDTQSLEYQWYKSDLATPTNFEPITVFGTGFEYLITNGIQDEPEGIYKLEVIDKNNCTVYSQEITVIEDCGSPGGPPCIITPDPNIQISGSWNLCGTILGIINYDYPPDQIVWSSSPSLNYESGQGSPVAYFTTDVPGSHTLYAQLTYGECQVTHTVTVVKNYHPELNISVECNDDGTYDIKLNNNSMVYPSSSGITYGYSRKEPNGYYSVGSSTNPQYSVSINNLVPGTYTYRLRLTSPGKPICEVEHTITLEPMPEPDDFIVTAGPYCPNQKIELTIPNFPVFNAAGYTFVWDIQDYGTLTASETTTYISFPDGGNYPVTLAIQTPMGCILESTPKLVNIPDSGYSGDLSTNMINICEGVAFAGLTFSSTGINPPHKVVWMNGNEVAGISSPYTAPFFPTESGLYWVMLENTNGCRFTNLTTGTTADVTIRKRPYAAIVGSETLCFGDTMTLVGDITDPTLQRRWLRNGTPLAPYGAWNSSNPLEIEIEGTATGSFTYTFEVRPVDDWGCGSSVSHNLTVYPPAPVPEFTYEVLLCEPYTVALSITNPQSGQYNWSSGAAGTDIEVYIGGVHGVTHTDPNGCETTFELTVPHHTQRYLWMMPKGCFDVCPWSEPAPYIVGPWANFDYHEWLVNGSIAESDTDSPVHDLVVDQPGTYQLALEQGDCRYESELTFISPDLESCRVRRCDRLQLRIEGIDSDGSGIYLIYGEISNPYAHPVTVTFSSFNGYGTYTPGSVTIPSGGTYYFPPLMFTSTSGFYGGDDYLIISVAEIPPCMTLEPIHFPMTGPSSAKLIQEIEADSNLASLKVTPNPSEVLAMASYTLGEEYQKAENLKVYTMSGRLVTTIDLDTNHDDVLLDISTWPSGTYIISLQADGKTILHQKLIKK